jgi:hypothetical protein
MEVKMKKAIAKPIDKSIDLTIRNFCFIILAQTKKEVWG